MYVFERIRRSVNECERVSMGVYVLERMREIEHESE